MYNANNRNQQVRQQVANNQYVPQRNIRPVHEGNNQLAIIQNVAEPREPVGQERRPKLDIRNGTLNRYQPEYLFGEEAEEIMHRYFRETFGRDADRAVNPKYAKYSGYKYHRHPLGATLRAFFYDLVTLKYTNTGTVIDIGGSRKRLAGRFNTNGAPLHESHHTTNPILDCKDLEREKGLTKADKLVSFCRCLGREASDRCKQCNYQFNHAITIDSNYYPGVLEEFSQRVYESKGFGYMVFNDYHMAMLKNGLLGRCADGESIYEIKQDKVTVTVEGNLAPYKHGFIKTNGLRNWQYRVRVCRSLGQQTIDPEMEIIDTFYDKVVHPVDKTPILGYLVCEEHETIWNKDVPYRLVKCHFVSDEELVAIGGDISCGYDGVSIMNTTPNTFFYSADEDENMIQHTSDEGTAKLIKAWDECTKRPLSPPEQKLTTFGLHETKLKKISSKDKQLNFRDRMIEQYGVWQECKNIIEAMSGKGYDTFFVSQEEVSGVKIENITLQIKEMRFGLPLFSSVIKAEVWAVHAAYIALGAKVTDSAEYLVLTQLQKADEVNAYKYVSAVKIAKAIRDIERNENLRISGLLAPKC
jgi:hypothetical protein